MFFTPLRRDELLSIVQNERPSNLFPILVDQFKQIGESPTDPIAVWQDNPIPEWPLPNLLIIPAASKSEFLAWTSSFVKIKPLTSVIRILDYDTLNLTGNPIRKTERIMRSVAGLVIAEALTYLEQGAPKLTLRPCEGTFSFAVGRSVLSVLGDRGLSLAGFNWFRTRQALANKLTKLRSEELRQPWAAILHLLGAKIDEFDLLPAIQRCVDDLYKNGIVSAEHWRNLTREIPEVQSLEGLMRETREERVITLERALRSLTSRNLKREQASFIAGYLLSMVAPGTLEHWKLLDPVKNVFPTSGLWYGLCAAIRQETAIPSYGGGLGRLIIRELERNIDLLERPTCDVAIDELEVLGPAYKVDQFATASNTNVEVEISPGVTIPFRSMAKDSAPVSGDAPYLDFGAARSNSINIDPSILGVVEDVIKDLQEIRREVKRIIPEAEQLNTKPRRKKRPKQ